jgi:hypothetical protein
MVMSGHLMPGVMLAADYVEKDFAGRRANLDLIVHTYKDRVNKGWV